MNIAYAIKKTNRIYTLQNFFLVIDTETSGLPKNWKKSYCDEKNWPHILQIAWVIFDADFNEVKRENHYLKNDGVSISKTAIKIHKITADFLSKNGEEKEGILLKFIDDLKTYNPLIIGHFIEFDYHILNAEFNRIGNLDVLKDFNFFCTMKASTPFVKNPAFTELKLNQFYEEVFKEAPNNLHNALYDVINTAKIFFYLFKINQSEERNFLNQYAFKPSDHEQGIKKLATKNVIFQMFSIFSFLWKIN